MDMNPRSPFTQYFRKVVSVGMLLFFSLSSVLTPAAVHAQSLSDLPPAGAMVKASDHFQPAVLKGIKVDPANPLQFDFIVDKGDSLLDGPELEQEGKKLIKYFLTALTVPENDLWVNLSPYEGNRIIADKFGLTEMGRDLLAEDYMLKQLTASMMDPNAGLGREFWQRVYERAQKEFGTTDIPVDTFNKVWIMPDKAKIYEKGNNVYLVESRMKVLLEQDYVALQNNKIDQSPSEDNDKYKVSKFASDIVREVIIPELTREVNEGKNFAKLRQVHNSLVLAAWYRKKVKESLLGTAFVGQNKIAGSESNDPASKGKIYQQYLEAFKKGVYSYIKEDFDTYSQQMIPRKYFSGGYAGAAVDFAEAELPISASGRPQRLVDIRASLRPTTVDAAMTPLPTGPPTALENAWRSGAEEEEIPLIGGARNILGKLLRSKGVEGLPAVVTAHYEHGPVFFSYYAKDAHKIYIDYNYYKKTFLGLQSHPEVAEHVLTYLIVYALAPELAKASKRTVKEFVCRWVKQNVANDYRAIVNENEDPEKVITALRSEVLHFDDENGEEKVSAERLISDIRAVSYALMFNNLLRVPEKESFWGITGFPFHWGHVIPGLWAAALTGSRKMWHRIQKGDSRKDPVLEFNEPHRVENVTAFDDRVPLLSVILAQDNSDAETHFRGWKREAEEKRFHKILTSLGYNAVVTLGVFKRLGVLKAVEGRPGFVAWVDDWSDVIKRLDGLKAQMPPDFDYVKILGALWPAEDYLVGDDHMGLIAMNKKNPDGTVTYNFGKLSLQEGLDTVDALIRDIQRRVRDEGLDPKAKAGRRFILEQLARIGQLDTIAKNVMDDDGHTVFLSRTGRKLLPQEQALIELMGVEDRYSLLEGHEMPISGTDLRRALTPLLAEESVTRKALRMLLAYKRANNNGLPEGLITKDDFDVILKRLQAELGNITVDEKGIPLNTARLVNQIKSAIPRDMPFTVLEYLLLHPEYLATMVYTKAVVFTAEKTSEWEHDFSRPWSEYLVLDLDAGLPEDSIVAQRRATGDQMKVVIPGLDPERRYAVFVMLKEVPKDKAMAPEALDAASAVNGGIDFSASPDLDIWSDGPEFQFKMDSGILQNVPFDGLTPTIINITPIQDVFMVLQSPETPGATLAASR